VETDGTNDTVAPNNPAAVELGRKGGKARAAKLSKEQIQEIGRRGAEVRWGKKRKKKEKK
jgi:general stress protein YciG